MGGGGRLGVLMLKLLGQRLALGVLTLFAVSILIFAVTEWLPGDIASNVLGQNATPDAVAAIRAELGLERPFYIRYAEWMGDAVQGDLGRSLANKRPVLDVIGPRLGNTLFLAIYVAVIAVPLSVTLGVLAATYRGGIFDRVMRAVSMAAISIPTFFIGYVLILFLSVHFRWFPTIAALKPEQGFFHHLYVAFLPMLTLTFVAVAHIVRMTQEAVGAAMSSSYVEMALLKGIPKRRIVMHHVLPNALAPIINAVAVNLAYLIVGAVVVEAVFTFDGIGRLIVDAVVARDIPMVQACGLIFAFVFIGLAVAADMLSILSNPQLRRAR